MSFDHRASIAAHIDRIAAGHEARKDGELAAHFKALAQTVRSALDMEPDQRDLANPVQVIALAVSARTKISVSEILGRSQHMMVLPSRYATAWLAQKRTGMTLNQIALTMGYADTSPLKAAIKRAEEMRLDNEDFYRLTEDLVVQELRCSDCGSVLVM